MQRGLNLNLPPNVCTHHLSFWLTRQLFSPSQQPSLHLEQPRSALRSSLLYALLED